MKIRGLQIKAVLYLHLLRTWRYKYGFINSTINMALWITIFVLGALMFAPQEQIPLMGPYMFWGIFTWNIISNSVWYISGWSNFFLISTGLMEEHLLHGLKTIKFLMGRIITITVQLALASFPIYILIKHYVGEGMPFITHPAYLIIGIITVTIIALSYALFLAAIGLRTNIPGPLLDFTNFILFLIGGIIIPISLLPNKLKIIALLIPYSHPSEIIRYGATGTIPYIGLQKELCVSILLSTTILLTAYYFFEYIEENYIKTKGIKAIGRM